MGQLATWYRLGRVDQVVIMYTTTDHKQAKWVMVDISDLILKMK